MRKKGILQILAGGILAIIAVILTIYGNVPNLPAVQPPPLSAAQPQISQTSLNFTSNAFTQYRQPLQTLQSPNPALGDFTLAAENQFLRLFVQPNSLAIKVQNVQTGYIFSSTLDNMEDHQLNNTWRNFVQSAATIDFQTASGTVTISL